MGSEKYILPDFAKYLSFSEVQRNIKVVLMFSSDFRKNGVCSKSATKMLYWNKFR